MKFFQDQNDSNCTGWTWSCFGLVFGFGRSSSRATECHIQVSGQRLECPSNYFLHIVNRFPVDRWLDEGEGDKRTSLDLEPDKKPGQLTGKILHRV